MALIWVYPVCPVPVGPRLRRILRFSKHGKHPRYWQALVCPDGEGIELQRRRTLVAPPTVSSPQAAACGGQLGRRRYPGCRQDLFLNRARYVYTPLSPYFPDPIHTILDIKRLSSLPCAEKSLTCPSPSSIASSSHKNLQRLSLFWWS